MTCSEWLWVKAWGVVQRCGGEDEVSQSVANGTPAMHQIHFVTMSYLPSVQQHGSLTVCSFELQILSLGERKVTDTKQGGAWAHHAMTSTRLKPAGSLVFSAKLAS